MYKLLSLIVGCGDTTSVDVLTCGDCNNKFPLDCIVKNIQHKVNCCDNTNEDTEDVDMEEEADCARETEEKCIGSPSVTGSGQLDEDYIGKENIEEKKEADSREALEEKLKRKDAANNTVNTGDINIFIFSGIFIYFSNCVCELGSEVLECHDKRKVC